VTRCLGCWRPAPNGGHCDTCTKGECLGVGAPLKLMPWAKWLALFAEQSRERKNTVTEYTERFRTLSLSQMQQLLAVLWESGDYPRSVHERVNAVLTQADSRTSAQPAGETARVSTWFYAANRDSEDWRGPHDTLEEAIAEARSHNDGESFWVDEALPIDWNKTISAFADADDLLERFADYVHDNEYVEEPEPEFKTSREEAQADLEAWAIKHIDMPAFWRCVGNAQIYQVKP